MRPWIGYLGVIVLAASVAGCASKPKARGPAVFCPPPPDPPRLQFLRCISSSLDIEKENKFLSFLTGQREIPKTFTKPYGVAIHKGKIFTCDSAGTIEVIDLVNRTFDFWVPQGAGAFQKPIGIAVDSAGNRYVADVERGQVVFFDPQGNYQGAIGDKESMKPTGVAVGGGRLYVTNLKKQRVEAYDLASREMVFSVPQEGAGADARLFQPTNIALDKDNHLYVSDTAGFHIKVFDAEGKFLRQFGKVGTAYGDMVRPKGIAVDREKRVYNVDAATELVQIFDDQSRLLLFFGKESGAPGLVLPAGICIDYDNVPLFQEYADPGFELEYLVLITSQLGNDTLSIYGFGHKK